MIRNSFSKIINNQIKELPNRKLFKPFSFNNKNISNLNFLNHLLNLRSSCIHNYCFYSFSAKKKDNKNHQKTQQNQTIQSGPKSKDQNQEFSPQQSLLIRSYNPDEIFNTILDLDSKHNFQKDLIVAKKKYQRSTKELRANILFEDLLKTEIKISIYNTKGRPYNHWWMKNLFNIFFFALTFWFINSWSSLDPKNKVILERTTAGKSLKIIMYGLSLWFIVIGFYKYLKFQRRFVQKIIYDTQKENFIITKRKFFGSRYENEVSRYKIVYTQNEFLNKKGTNYFHLDTKEQYSIPYKQYWVKQDLFSHLIAQRIKI